MKVEINKREIETGVATTLEQLLKSENLNGPGMAVAVDGNVVRRTDWATTALYEGMKITVIRAVCGG